MTTETEKAYLAGLVDGEGHIGITTAKSRPSRVAWHSHYMIVTLANTHIQTLVWVKSQWNGTLVIRKQPKQTVPIGNLRWSSAQAVAVLKDIQPYLRIKVAQTDLALQFANIMASREKATKFISEEEWNLREELRMAIRQINRPDPTLKKTPYPAERYMRDCAYCGNQFDRRGTTKLYCSPKCHNKALYQKRKQK